MNNKKFPNIKLLLYNLRLFSGNITSAGPVYRDNLRITAVVKKLGDCDYDVVGFNEVWSDITKEAIVASLQREYPFHYYCPNDSAGRIGSGLLLLSRYRIVDIRFTPYQCLEGWDRHTQKGIITARLVLPSGSGGYDGVYLVLTQTQKGSTEEAIDARKKNLETLRQVIHDLPTGDSPLVLFGNLNVVAEFPNGTPTGEYMYLANSMKTLFLKDLYREVYPDPLVMPGHNIDSFTNRLHRIFNPDEPKSHRVDYFFSRGLTTSVGYCSVASDFLFNDTVATGLMDISDYFPMLAHFK